MSKSVKDRLDELLYLINLPMLQEHRDRLVHLIKTHGTERFQEGYEEGRNG